MKTADFRSLAPIKSYAIEGFVSEEFARLDYHDDYETTGSYSFFGDAKTITVNIGTDVLRPVRTHQLEYILKVPYLEKIWRLPLKLNCSKWERDLLRNGFLHNLKINDLLIRVLPDQNYVDYFTEQIRKNPYYLVD